MTFSLEAIEDLLSRTPGALRALLGGIGDRWAHASEGPKTFTPFDVVGHLIDGEETDWVPRARIILARDGNNRFEPYDRFRHLERNVGRTLDSLLEEFARLRGENLATVRGWHLTPADLDLPGEHPSLGAVTLRQLLAAWVVHDLGHLAQAERVIAKQFREDAGPWVPFLPVLTDHDLPRS